MKSIWQPLARYSDFALQTLQRWPEACQTLIDTQRLYDSGLAIMPTFPDLALADFDRSLRCYRQTECLRICWREFMGEATVEESLKALSSLAEQCIQAALIWHRNDLQNRFGKPILEDGSVAGICVIGMGKLGGAELNFSSDIDIVFIHNGAGKTTTTADQRRILQEQFFTRLAQQLCQSLDAINQYGQVYRVDTRLRPFGGSGPLVWNTDATEQYFLTQGRDWERYAWQKARPVAGDCRVGEMLLAELRPFIYRRYLDYGLFAGVRQIRADIAREAGRRRTGDNVKLGPGGIREIEFLVQSLQLLRGGAQPALQERNLLDALQLLHMHKQISETEYAQLHAAYIFLRKVENRLQMRADQQCHTLPEAVADRELLTRFYGYPDKALQWSELLEQLDMHRTRVQKLFMHWFSEPDSLSMDDRESALADFTARTDIETLKEHISNVEQQLRRTGLSKTSLQRWQSLATALCGDAAGNVELESCLTTTLDMLASIAPRSNYLALLIEQPLARMRMLKLCARSEYLTEQIRRYPVLLDDLIDPLVLQDIASDKSAIRQRLLQAQPAKTDLELWLHRTKQWQKSYQLRLAMNWLFESITHTELQKQLTWLAEVIIGELLELCREQYPELATVEFAVIAYGTLGAQEMHFTSDLDLTFLYQPDTNDPQHSEYQAARLTQKLTHWLTTPLPGESLYAIDTRLRPNGSSGTLVSSFSAFARYQAEKAWIWELQALTRARVISGASGICRVFDDIRGDVLMQSRDCYIVAAEMSSMWQRMQTQQKLSLLDECRHRLLYLCQYWFLTRPLNHPPSTNTIQQLTQLKQQIPDEADQLHALWESLQVMQIDSELLAPSALDLATVHINILTLWQQIIVEGSAA